MIHGVPDREETGNPANNREGSPSMNHKSTQNPRGEHAVVIGASMGGLAAAAAVAPFFSRVTLLDRDELPGTAAPRRGVPQGRHAHALQPGGLLALDELLPGLSESLVAGGASAGDICADGGWFVGGGLLARRETGTRGMGFTRPYVEQAVRDRVAALSNVTIRDRVEVLTPLADGHTVTGLLVAPAGGGAAEEIAADLVIDASGRVSRLPEWLEQLGLPTPAEDRVHCKMAYLTRRWQLTNDTMGGDIAQVITPAETPHFGVIIAQEDGSHIVTLGGLLDQAPAKDDDAYLAFARALPYGRIADALEGAIPVTDYQPSHFPYSRRRRFDKLSSHPRGLIALGDSIASFNPMYGQGMSVAALEAVALRDLLRRGPLDPRAFYKRAHRLEDVAWKISTGGDLRYEAVEGKRTPDMKVMNAYLDRLTAAAQTDSVLTEKFLRVAGFLDRPESFFAPSIVWRVLRPRRTASAAVAAVAPVRTPVG
jgi:2-polyprenyl-6-methoxyphenol hydroxylase-like FAD-dependent oxidoreductase